MEEISRKMKIAFITSLNGGVGKFTFSLSDKLSSKRDITAIDIYGFSNQKRIPLPKLKKKVSVVELFYHPLHLFFWLFYHLDKLKAYDIVQINQAIFVWPVLIHKFAHKNIEVVYSSRTTYIFDHAKAIEAFFLMFDMISFPVASRLANVHTTFSHFNRLGLNQRFGATPTVVYNGIDPSIYKFSEEKRELTRKNLRITDDAFLILYLGLLLPYKNVSDLINAMPCVLREIPSAKLLIVGRGPCLKRIIDRTTELDLNRNVIFKTGVVEDTTDYYSAADLFVFPAADGTHVLLEAMACGLPIIYAFSCSSPEIIGTAGISFQIRDQQELCERILTLAMNAELRQKKMMEAQTRIKQFDWKRVAEEYYRLYVNPFREGNIV